MLTENLRKEALSHAYLRTLAAWHGYIYQPGPTPDLDSVDASIRVKSSPRLVIDFQLKATSRANLEIDGLHFSLKRKNYNDLATERTNSLLLIVPELPSEESEWMNCTGKHLILRKCGWWLSLVGQDSLEAASKRVVIPPTQRIDESGLMPLVDSLLASQP